MEMQAHVAKLNDELKLKMKLKMDLLRDRKKDDQYYSLHETLNLMILNGEGIPGGRADPHGLVVRDLLQQAQRIMQSKLPGGTGTSAATVASGSSSGGSASFPVSGWSSGASVFASSAGQPASAFSSAAARSASVPNQTRADSFMWESCLFRVQNPHDARVPKDDKGNRKDSKVTDIEFTATTDKVNSTINDFGNAQGKNIKLFLQGGYGLGYAGLLDCGTPPQQGLLDPDSVLSIISPDARTRGAIKPVYPSAIQSASRNNPSVVGLEGTITPDDWIHVTLGEFALAAQRDSRALSVTTAATGRRVVIDLSSVRLTPADLVRMAVNCFTLTPRSVAVALTHAVANDEAHVEDVIKALLRLSGAGICEAVEVLNRENLLVRSKVRRWLDSASLRGVSELLDLPPS
jgi:hypothetical protein